ncbi:MAG: hypothetical protein ACLU80_05575 [Dorea sp.]
MIKATSQSVCGGITGCQVEILGSGAELLREYRGVTAAMYRSLLVDICQKTAAKEVLGKYLQRKPLNRRRRKDEDAENYNG